MKIFKKYFFETAHYMPNFPDDHKFSKIHGHSYELIIYLEGKYETKNGWIMNYEDIDKYVNPLLKKIDHNLMNHIKGLENPTSENIAKWFWVNLKIDLVDLVRVEVNRPRIGGCIYEGKD